MGSCVFYDQIRAISSLHLGVSCSSAAATISSWISAYVVVSSILQFPSISSIQIWVETDEQLPSGHLSTFPCPSAPWPGAVRHHRPASSSTKAEQRGSSARAPEVAIDFDAAEALGRKILGKGSWVKRIFEEFDGSVSWLLAKGFGEALPEKG